MDFLLRIQDEGKGAGLVVKDTGGGRWICGQG